MAPSHFLNTGYQELPKLILPISSLRRGRLLVLPKDGGPSSQRTEDQFSKGGVLTVTTKASLVRLKRG